MQFNIAEVVALRLHPFFHFQADLIFRELTRITNFYHYYYFMPTVSCMLQTKHKSYSHIFICFTEPRTFTQ